MLSGSFILHGEAAAKEKGLLDYQLRNLDILVPDYLSKEVLHQSNVHYPPYKASAELKFSDLRCNADNGLILSDIIP